jgi:hypothetical protein
VEQHPSSDKAEPSALAGWLSRLDALQRQATEAADALAGHCRLVPSPGNEADVDLLLRWRRSLNLGDCEAEEKKLRSAGENVLHPTQLAVNRARGTLADFMANAEGMLEHLGRGPGYGVVATATIPKFALSIEADREVGQPVRYLAFCALAELPSAHPLRGVLPWERTLGGRVVLGEAREFTGLFDGGRRPPRWVSLDGVRQWTESLKQRGEERLRWAREAAAAAERDYEAKEKARRAADMPGRLTDLERELAKVRAEKEKAARQEHVYQG